MEKDLEKSAKILRHELASIDLSDIDEMEKTILTDEEAMARAGDAETFYINHFEKVINLFILEQLKFIGEQATDNEKLQFGRGTFNGLCLMRNWFKKQINKSLSRFDEHREEETDTLLGL